jgi:Dinucleotide-utilizing enzymes involved in molybdopterin and thiamine biosynthesis family 1
MLLARMGFKYFTLIDYKSITKLNIVKHLYANINNIGQMKTKALKSYIHRIDKTIQIKTISQEILPKLIFVS